MFKFKCMWAEFPNLVFPSWALQLVLCSKVLSDVKLSSRCWRSSAQMLGLSAWPSLWQRIEQCSCCLLLYTRAQTWVLSAVFCSCKSDWQAWEPRRSCPGSCTSQVSDSETSRPHWPPPCGAGSKCHSSHSKQDQENREEGNNTDLLIVNFSLLFTFL